MSHEITRIFHPVGQGAFYSERHDVDGQKFNIVYDCGSFSVKHGTNVAENAFHDKEIIDILFFANLYVYFTMKLYWYLLGNDYLCSTKNNN